MTDTPTVLSCPACAGSVSIQASACSYCGNHLAMLRCPNCSTPHFLGAKHCTQCRHVLREAPRGPVQDSKCPHCQKRLLQTTFGESVADACEQCGGLFLAHHVLEDLMHAKERVAVVTGRAVRPVAVPDTKVKYIKCPACNLMMNRLNFAKRSGVIVDVCSPHGTWFDAGELALALEYVARGGRLQATDLVREEQARAQTRIQLNQSPAVLIPDPPSTSLVRTLAEVLGAVILGIFD